jgi:5'-nucleotidase
MPRGRRSGDTWIVQSAGRGTSISRVELDLDHENRGLKVRSAGLVDLPSVAAPADPATSEFLLRTFAHVGPVWDVPAGAIEGAADIRGRRGTAASTPAGNYVADLIRRAGAADLGLTNKGGIRTVLRPGPITRRQVFEFLPFDNSVVTFDMTGEHLRTLLSACLRRPRRPLEIAGGSYTYRVSEGGRQLVDVEVAGQPLDDARIYRVATNSFLAAGGEGYSVFSTLRNRREGTQWLRALMLTDLRTRGSIHLVAQARIRSVE